ncbi:hypothetical protein DL768_004531 [Monosporascus sp. mg162]|nr:hypothetical protein DL768_004531 [Monosporascus sp. mg162]
MVTGASGKLPVLLSIFMLLSLGSGVDLVFSRLSTERFARKRVLRGRGSEQSQQCLIQELRELRRLNHQHLVKIVGSYTDIHYIAYLMKPVAEVTLEEFLSGSQPLKSRCKVILRRFYGCLAGAMNYLYTHRVRPRDLTARNILIDSAGEVYISDFGSAYNWTSKPSSRTKNQNIPTSPDYMAPEIAKGDERGTKSDMWSLGVVFLEMTTKLLNHRPADLRSRIRLNADKTKAQPYPYANMTVVINWMQILGNTKTDYDHDREPLSWVRELLHDEHEHRLTPPQLMKYILESPSFGVFRCLKCEDDFQNEAFAYGPTTPRGDPREDSRQTREAIEALFDSYSSKPASGGMSLERTDSVKKWIEDSSQFETPAAELPGLVFPDDTWDVEDVHAFDSIHAEQLLYNTYEYEFYHPTHFVHSPMDPSRGSDSLPSLSPTEPAELLGDISWTQETLHSPRVKPKPEIEEKVLQDSGLGFLEYVSNSSEDGKLIQPFEVISDRSSVQSEEDLPIQVLCDAFGILFQEDEPLKGARKKARGQRESNELLFEEEEDRSEAGNPWDETSDRSELEDRSWLSGQDATKTQAPVAEYIHAKATNITGQPLEPELGSGGLTPSFPGAAAKHTPLKSESKGAETEKVSELLPQDSKVSVPTIEEQLVKGVGVQGSLSLNPDDVDEERGQDTGSKLAKSTSIKKRRKKAGIVKEVEYIEEARPKLDGDGQHTVLPDIVINPGDCVLPESSRLSKANVRSMKERRRSSIVPRKRDALVPVDARKLMDNTWEMASSAPTSAISEDTKFKISKFFYMIPDDVQIESVLCDCCKKGSAGAVKTLLQKASSRTKPLKPRQYFVPLMYAVRGASTHHNKCVRELLAAGVDPNHKSKKTGLTPLHIAVKHPNFKGYMNLIWLLLSNKNKANPNARDWNGEPPLMKLFAGADTAPLEPHKRGALIMLLKEGAKPDFTLPGTGNTPLHLAVRRQDKIAVAMLLHMGAAVDAKNTSGTTPLQMTANQFRGELSADHAEVLDHLLQYGARADERAGALDRTALHWAVIAGCAQAVARLLEARGDARLRDKDGYDAVGLALKYAEKLTAGGDEGKIADHVEIMLGLERAANCGWKLEEGTCAVETACRSEGELLETLMENGLDPKSKFRQGTIVEFARQEGSDVAKRLLEGWEAGSRK